MAFIKYSNGKVKDVIKENKEDVPKEAKESLEKYEELKKEDKSKLN